MSPPPLTAAAVVAGLIGLSMIVLVVLYAHGERETEPADPRDPWRANE